MLCSLVEAKRASQVSDLLAISKCNFNAIRIKENKGVSWSVVHINNIYGMCRYVDDHFVQKMEWYSLHVTWLPVKKNNNYIVTRNFHHVLNRNRLLCNTMHYITIRSPSHPATYTPFASRRIWTLVDFFPLPLYRKWHWGGWHTVSLWRHCTVCPKQRDDTFCTKSFHRSLCAEASKCPGTTAFIR